MLGALVITMIACGNSKGNNSDANENGYSFEAK